MLLCFMGRVNYLPNEFEPTIFDQDELTEQPSSVPGAVHSACAHAFCGVFPGVYLSFNNLP